ncbi:hypothetical protein [Pseudanabaena sp. ABRG5-3]|uniref:hypothetical protein n=1 Tax=Pseudanabaena sp. ABRG5-3 TaxID=685565 RepID=UPI000DC6F9FC|nr:hypothetical protein [Pseudanabaena sp. ABRG5-3]BBC26804.1 hypothetical protein ABRG53_b091 [Pseudanabaena sp. ABRG5-3]
MSDATPAYRGYRLQTLYTLARVLEPNERGDLIFQPEGAEDLAIWDMSDHLLETIQVKAYGTDLTLSMLSPEKADSFVYRADKLLCDYPEMSIRIASFGKIGVELFQATREDSSHRVAVTRKISEKGFLSEAKARILIDHLQIVSLVESELEKEIFNTLGNLCTGIDPIPAFDMLNFWLYRCAENKSKITRKDVIQRINDVGRFISERNAYHSEWFRSIIPIENKDVDTQTREKLSNDFYRGISARYDHILAAVDKPRISKLNEIAQKFKEKQVVIVHGASGQGKTTIAYRYLHDFFPDQWRFQVRLIENRQQAVNIATALSGQAKAIGIPIAVYLDVSPNDIGWDELVKQLSSHKNIQILVTVREEDFRRASISGTEIQFAEVELKFDRVEAEEIYKFLVEVETPDRFLDFEDAWNRFGGGGPLMEFVYLVTQGDSLRERLQQQIRRIQDEVRSGQCSDKELELLRLVSVASAFEARLKLRELVRFLQLPSPQRTLELLEEEYLLRTSEGGTIVGGLHPIRSTILADILTDPTFYPWADSASTCLTFIFEQDMGSFLLYAFSRHRFELEPLLSVLDNYQPRQWTAIAGVINALIWLGIKEYVEANKELILEAYEKVHHGWSLVLDFDIADAKTGIADEWVSDLSHLMPEDGLAHIASLRSRQTNKKQIFTRVSKWLLHLNKQPISPQSDLDWTKMAEVLVWVGHLQISLPISDWLAQMDLNSVIDTLSLEILANIALGLFYINKADYHSWLNTNYIRLIKRFKKETQTVLLEDDGQKIRIHFIVDLFSLDTFSEVQIDQQDIQKSFMSASMKRLELIRRFFPDRERYRSKGYGHLIWINAELHDETEKDILHSDFLLQDLVSLNSNFMALGDWDLRTQTLEEYANIVVELRQEIIQVLQKLRNGLENYFRQKKKIRILGDDIKSALWNSCKKSLLCSPLLPSCAVDEWGFVSERIDMNVKVKGTQKKESQNLVLQKYQPYLKVFSQYVSHCSNFFEQSEWILNFHPHIRDKSNDYHRLEELAKLVNKNLRQTAHLSTVNLGDVLKSLTNFQDEFDNLLFQFVNKDSLRHLKLLEVKTFKEVWNIWYFFAFHPDQKFLSSKKDCQKIFCEKVKEIRKSINKELRSISSNDIQISVFSEDVKWEDEHTLWIKIDSENAFAVYGAIETVVIAIKKAIISVPSNELRRYAIDFTWSNIVIVPLIKSKSLDGTAWRFSSLLFSVDPDHDLNRWNFLTVVIPSNAFSQLGLSTWSHSRLKTAQTLMGLISSLSILASHIRDFERLPELDELGHEILQQYLQQLATPLSETFQSISNVETEIISCFSELSPIEQEKRTHLVTAMKILIEMHKQILPSADCSRDEKLQLSMNLEEISDWANRLDNGQQLAFSMYLSWVSDVLECV